MPPALRLRLPACAALALLLAACKPPLPPQSPVAPGSPQEAVQRLAGDLARADLAGFARDALPAGDHAALDRAWREGRSRWPLTVLPLDDKLAPMIVALAAPDAERRLGASYDSQFAGQGAEIRQSVRTLAQFGSQYVQNEPNLDAAERAHYGQLIPALAEWAANAPLADAARAHQALRGLVAAARASGVHGEADLREPGLDRGLARLTPFLAALLDAAAGYGLDLRASLADLRSETATIEGEQARVPVAYALAGRVVRTEVRLQRQDGRWYLASALAAARAARDAAAAVDAAPATPAESGKPLPAPAP
ncbi:MAG: hypothetical protein QM601_14295 [Pseudoxanthomonas sp.]